MGPSHSDFHPLGRTCLRPLECPVFTFPPSHFSSPHTVCTNTHLPDVSSWASLLLGPDHTVRNIMGDTHPPHQHAALRLSRALWLRPGDAPVESSCLNKCSLIKVELKPGRLQQETLCPCHLVPIYGLSISIVISNIRPPYHLSGVGSQEQQPKQGGPDLPLLSYFIQLFQGDLEARAVP